MEFVEIFTQMHWVPALLLILGLVFIVIELFVPGFGFFGISGSLSLIAGVIVRICQCLNIIVFYVKLLILLIISININFNCCCIL